MNTPDSSDWLADQQTEAEGNVVDSPEISERHNRSGGMLNGIREYSRTAAGKALIAGTTAFMAVSQAFNNKEAHAQAPANLQVAAQAGGRQPVFVAAANNRPVINHPPLAKPLNFDNAPQILQDAATNHPELAEALDEAKAAKNTDANRKAATLLLEIADGLARDPQHSEQIWDLVFYAYKYAKQAQDLDLMYRSRGHMYEFGVGADKVTEYKVQDFLYVLGEMKKKSPEQIALVKFELFELMNEAYGADLYKEVSDLYTKARPALQGSDMRGEYQSAKNMSVAALKLGREYEKVAKKLKQNPNDPHANTEMGKFYVTKKGSWRQGLNCFVMGDDQQLAQLSQNLLNSESLFLLGAQLQPQDVDHLVDLAHDWQAYGDAHRDMKDAAYEVAVTCYLAMKDVPNNNVQQAAVVAFLSQNKQKPIDLSTKGDVMRGVELPVKSIDLLAQQGVHTHINGGLGRPIIRGKMQKDLVTRHGANAAGYELVPVDIQGDYILEVRALLGSQPDWQFQSNEIGYVSVSFPVKDHMLTFVMNERDINGTKLGGLSLVDGRRLPNGACYEDELKTSIIPLDIMVKVEYRGDLADVTVLRNDGLQKKWTIETDKCRADRIFQDKNGNDQYGIIVGGQGALRFNEMQVHALNGNVEVRVAQPNQQAAAGK